jgi:hypothetical protein
MADKYGDGKGGIRVPSELQQVYALLFDARYLCGNTPWRPAEFEGEEPAAKRRS